MKKILLFSAILMVLGFVSLSDAEAQRRSDQTTTRSTSARSGRGTATRGTSARSGRGTATRGTSARSGRGTTSAAPARAVSRESAGAEEVYEEEYYDDAEYDAPVAVAPARSGRGTSSVRSGRTRGSGGLSRSAGVSSYATPTVATSSSVADSEVETPVEEYVDLDKLKVKSSQVLECQSTFSQCIKESGCSAPNAMASIVAKEKLDGMHLCYCSPQYVTFKKKEKEIFDLDAKIFRGMAEGKNYATMSTEERSIFDDLKQSIAKRGSNNDTKAYDDLEEEQDVSIQDMMAEIESLTASMDTDGSSSEKSGKALFDAVVKNCESIAETCAPAFGGTKEGALKALTAHVASQTGVACRAYDDVLRKEYQKKQLVFDKVLGTAALAKIKQERSKLDNTACIISLKQQAQVPELCGEGFAKCMSCDIEDAGGKSCSQYNKDMLRSQKAMFEGVLEKCRTGKGTEVFEAFLTDVGRIIDRFAIQAKYAQAKDGVQAFAESQKACKQTLGECVSNLCGSKSTGWINCAKKDLLEMTLSQGSKTYYQKDDTGQDLTDADGNKIELSLGQLVSNVIDVDKAYEACASERSMCQSGLALLTKNPYIDQDVVSQIEADGGEALSKSILEQVFTTIQENASSNIEKQRGKLVAEQIAHLEQMTNMYETTKAAEITKYKMDGEVVAQKAEVDSDVIVRSNTADLTAYQSSSDLSVNKEKIDTKEEITKQILAEAKEFAEKRPKLEKICRGLGGTFETVEIATDGTESGEEKVPAGGVCRLDVKGLGKVTSSSARRGSWWWKRQTDIKSSPTEGATQVLVSTDSQYNFDCQIQGDYSYSNDGKFLGYKSSSTSTTTESCQLPNGQKLTAVSCVMPSLIQMMDNTMPENSCLPVTEASGM
ncbi:MAG: hypothetical protein JXR30_02415 [Alphaproteobacteria bacterium]|nr:hypothetical protein [Alphaproteobacteria bacterium]